MSREPNDVEYNFSVGPRHVYVRINHDSRGKPREFAIQVNTADGDEVARMDCCHDELHTHYWGPVGDWPMHRSSIKNVIEDPVEWADWLYANFDDLYRRMLNTAETGEAP